MGTCTMQTTLVADQGRAVCRGSIPCSGWHTLREFATLPMWSVRKLLASFAVLLSLLCSCVYYSGVGTVCLLLLHLVTLTCSRAYSRSVVRVRCEANHKLPSFLDNLLQNLGLRHKMVNMITMLTCEALCDLKVDKCLIPVKIAILYSCKLPTAVWWK